VLTKTSRATAFCAVVVAVVCGLQFSAAQQPYKKSAYGRAVSPKIKGEQPSRAIKIDTTKKPMPKDDLAVVITAHSGDPSDPDVNWADGSFSLTKAGDGQTIHVSGSLIHHVVAPLAGYGTTETGLTWIYEIKGLKVGGKKVFVAISSQYSGDELRRVFISLGDDAPTDFASFAPSGYAVAGKPDPLN
jgi:hypothetical protein